MPSGGTPAVPPRGTIAVPRELGVRASFAPHTGRKSPRSVLRHLFIRRYVPGHERSRSTSDLSPGAGTDRYLKSVAPTALHVLPLLSVIAVALIACRVVASRRTLASRTRLAVLAPDSFDPSIDAVLRCAAQLSRVRRSVGGWLDPRARAVRVLLDCDGEGRMRYTLSVARSSTAGGARGARHLTGSRSKSWESIPSGPPRHLEADCAGARTHRASRGSRRASSGPAEQRAAGTLPLKPDPLQPFAARHGTPERRPWGAGAGGGRPPSATPATRRRRRWRLLREARRRAGTSATPGGASSGGLWVTSSGRQAVTARAGGGLIEVRAEREQIADEAVAGRAALSAAAPDPLQLA